MSEGSLQPSSDVQVPRDQGSGGDKGLKDLETRSRVIALGRAGEEVASWWGSF